VNALVKGGADAQRMRYMHALQPCRSVLLCCARESTGLHRKEMTLRNDHNAEKDIGMDGRQHLIAWAMPAICAARVSAICFSHTSGHCGNVSVIHASTSASDFFSSSTLCSTG
jgi:hypothetical protein